MSAGARRGPGGGATDRREIRAKALAAMGLVERRGASFFVKTAAVRSQQRTFEVRRDAERRVVCSCEEFGGGKSADARQRCEHILAVKYWLESQNPTSPDATVARSGATGALSNQAALPARFPAHTPASKPPAPIQSAARSAGQTASPHNPRGGRVAPVIPLHGFAATLRRLRQGIPERHDTGPEQPGPRRAGGLSWHLIAGLLDRAAPGWRHSFVREQQLGRHVVVTASITIGGVTREGLGTGPAGSEAGIETARLDALKSAAANFGVARELFAPESADARGPDREDGPRPDP